MDFGHFGPNVQAMGFLHVFYQQFGPYEGPWTHVTMSLFFVVLQSFQACIGQATFFTWKFFLISDVT